jgi:hypothetical protein
MAFYRWASGHATPMFLISQASDNVQQLSGLDQVITFILKQVIFLKSYHDFIGFNKLNKTKTNTATKTQLS